MPISLPDVDLTGKIAGNTGKILLANMGISAGGVSAHPRFTDNPPTIYFHNDSGCTLGIAFKDSGQSFTLPAGAWIPHPIKPGESEIDWNVKNVLPNPPISLLTIDYYFPGELIPQTSTLGNSPVGIGGSVSTSSVQTLSNEGGAANVLVEDIGDLANAQLYTLYSDGHTLWKVDQAGVAHQCVKINTSGNPLQLGQAGDISEILGALTVDQTSILTGIVTAASANVLGTAGNLQHILGALTVDQTSILTGIITAAAANVFGAAGNQQHILGSLLIDKFLSVLVGSSGDLQVSGSVAGTSTLWQPFRGDVKGVLIYISNPYNSATLQTFALPSAFANGALVIALGNSGPMRYLQSGGAQSVDVLTSLASGGGGVATVTVVQGHSIGFIKTSFNQIEQSATGAIGAGHVLVIGS